MNLLEGQKELARKNERRRSMFMVRGGEDQPCQVMFNTVMKDSEPPIHRHKYRETFMVVEGIFDFWSYPKMPDGSLSENVFVYSLFPGDTQKAEPEQYHTFRCISESGVIMEFKNAYYNPEADKEIHV